ncbi:hypothetical protein JTE90_024242 [Oedothorax gibbosus]|uniref:Uncharacterized protein n=1 Tax=Oedothorax gibbosus TaxID=931172 RepID=A0AAV6TXK8_9ARAC|nr:hypothetical protein JTE90_024242 [Oedothorax gibbosus]
MLLVAFDKVWNVKNILNIFHIRKSKEREPESPKLPNFYKEARKKKTHLFKLRRWLLQYHGITRSHILFFRSHTQKKNPELLLPPEPNNTSSGFPLYQPEARLDNPKLTQTRVDLSRPAGAARRTLFDCTVVLLVFLGLRAFP